MVKSILVAAALTLLATLAIGARAEAQPLDTNGNSVTVIGTRPPGCPHAYCGCGLRLFLGLTDKRLNKASMWARIFPRVGPQPGAVAVRPHHVFLLVSHIAGDVYLTRDYNSGRGLSRLHPRSVRGYVFVKPGVSDEINMAAKSRNSFDFSLAARTRTSSAKSARRWRVTSKMGEATDFGKMFGAVQ